MSSAEHHSPHVGISLSKLEARRHLVVKRGWIRPVMHTVMAHATEKGHTSHPPPQVATDRPTVRASLPPYRHFTACCIGPKITNKNPTAKDCRSNLPAAVWRLPGFSSRCRQRWSYQAVTGPRTGTGHLCLGQSGCPGESPSRTSPAE